MGTALNFSEDFIEEKEKLRKIIKYFSLKFDIFFFLRRQRARLLIERCVVRPWV